MTEIVSRASAVPDLQSLPPFERPKIKPGDPIRFPVQVVAMPGDRQSKRGVILSHAPGFSAWEVMCDEGTSIGGDDTAPSPLAYLVMGVAFCLLTHVQGYLHRKPMQIDGIKVELRGEYATLPPDPDKGMQGEGRCDAFTAHVLIDSPESSEVLQELVRVCRDACMAIATVAQAIPTTTRVFVNGAERGTEI